MWQLELARDYDRDKFGVPARSRKNHIRREMGVQNINGKLIASVMLHLYEEYYNNVRETVYNKYELTVSCWRP